MPPSGSRYRSAPRPSTTTRRRRPSSGRSSTAGAATRPSSRAWGDSAQRAFVLQLRDTPDDAQRHVFRGLALAYAGRRDEAIAEGERGVALLPDQQGRGHRTLPVAPARPHLRARRSAGEGAGSAREADGGALLSHAGLAPDRSRVRAAAGQSAVRAAGARNGVTNPSISRLMGFPRHPSFPVPHARSANTAATGSVRFAPSAARRLSW